MIKDEELKKIAAFLSFDHDRLDILNVTYTLASEAVRENFLSENGLKRA